MATGGNTTMNNAVILERLEALRCDIVQLSTELKQYAQEHNQFQLDYERRHALLDAKADSAHARLDSHSKEINDLKESLKVLKESVTPLILQSKIISWIAGILGASIIALIWGLITHTVSIGLP